MKNKIRTSIKFGILFLGIFLFVTNCQKDDEIIDNIVQDQTNSKYQVRNISFEEIESKSVLQKPWNKLSKYFKRSFDNTNLSKVNSNDGSFTILTDRIVEVSTDTTTVYSFLIETPINPESVFENFVIIQHSDLAIEMFIYKYSLLNNAETDLDFINEFPYSISFEEVTEDQIDLGCFQDLIQSKTTMVLTGSNGCEYTLSLEWFCMDYETPEVDCYEDWVIEGYDCSMTGITTTGGGETTDDTETSNNDNNNHDSVDDNLDNNNDPSLGDGIPNDPIEQPPIGVVSSIQPWQEIIDCMPNIFQIDGALDFLQNNKPQATQLKNNIKDLQGNCIAENFDFAEHAIIAFMEDNNVEVDFPNKVILHTSVLENQKVKCVYDKLKGLSSTIFNDIINDHFNSSKNSSIRFEIGETPWGEDAVTLPFVGDPSNNLSVSGYKVVINADIVDSLSAIEVALIYIHESIHAELIERCFRLGLIEQITFNSSGYPVIVFTSSPNVSYNTSDSIFNALATNYYDGGINSQWNHDLFTVFNHREKMAQNLVNIHPWLNDINNDFLTNVNNDPFIIGGTYTLEQLMDYISWIGLEGTQEYENSISSNVLELSKKIYVQSAAKIKYTNNCN